MEWLIKIVEGPMKGAEIALVEGISVSFGSGDDCDIIVHDATVPAKACEFEVDASGVRLTALGGSPEPLPAFEIRSFGTTSFAVGPVSGEWQSLIKPVRPAIERADPDTVPAAETPADAASPSHGEENASPAPDVPETRPPRRRGLAVAVFALVALVAAGILVWLFWPHIQSWCASHRQSSALTDVSAHRSLADLAATHGLILTNEPQSAARSPVLQGNLKRRTERLAIRALALAADPSVRFDLTDDETLLASSSELVFACSDGSLKVDEATNRVVTMSGFAPSRAALEKAIRALNADVKGIDRIDTSRVRVGGEAPEAVAKTPFVREEPPGEHPVVAIPAHTPNPPVKRTEKSRDCPIAGILTDPYPCVVLRNGVRLVEGAQIGKAVLVKIEADKLTLEDDGVETVWKP